MKKIFFCLLGLTFFKGWAQCPPALSYSLLTQTLTCYNPTVLATGSSTTPNTQISWQVPSNPPIINQPSIVIGPPTGPVTSTSTTQYATYTVVATNTAMACSSTSVIVINQNFKPPISSPTISVSSPTAIYCIAGTSPAVITVGNSTTTSGGGPTAFIANPCWAGPAPQSPTCGPSSYSCYLPGTYSLTVTDNYNGCSKTGTVLLLDRTQPPVIANPVSVFSMACGATAATVNIVLTGTTSGGVRYLFTTYPIGTSFSPSNACIVNQNWAQSGTGSSVIMVSNLGGYEYIVTNTLTGCQAAGTINVVPGDPINNLGYSYTGASCNSCCDGSVNISNGGFTSYSLSCTSGTVSGNPPNLITGICNGQFTICVTNTTNNCSTCNNLLMTPVGIKNNLSNSVELEIFPNPAAGLLKIKGSGKIRIFSTEGKLLRELMVEPGEEIEIDKLSSGIYFVELRTGQYTIRKKLIMLQN